MFHFSFCPPLNDIWRRVDVRMPPTFRASLRLELILGGDSITEWAHGGSIANLLPVNRWSRLDTLLTIPLKISHSFKARKHKENVWLFFSQGYVSPQKAKGFVNMSLGKARKVTANHTHGAISTGQGGCGGIFRYLIGTFNNQQMFR